MIFFFHSLILGEPMSNFSGVCGFITHSTGGILFTRARSLVFQKISVQGLPVDVFHVKPDDRTVTS